MTQLYITSHVFLLNTNHLGLRFDEFLRKSCIYLDRSTLASSRRIVHGEEGSKSVQTGHLLANVIHPLSTQIFPECASGISPLCTLCLMGCSATRSAACFHSGTRVRMFLSKGVGDFSFPDPPPSFDFFSLLCSSRSRLNLDTFIRL